jgi:hypothetical protein
LVRHGEIIALPGTRFNSFDAARNLLEFELQLVQGQAKA